MEILKKKIENGSVTVTLRIEPSEFDAALHEAYLENTDRLPVPGVAPGLAERAELQKLYGEHILYDEALDRCIPKMYLSFVAGEGIRPVGKPVLTEITWLSEGGAAFTAVCGVYPEVTLGEYKGVAVPLSRDDEGEFAAAVMKKVCDSAQCTVPDSMAEQKLSAMLAQEKMKISGDAVYHVLADCVYILDNAYRAAGVGRPMSQVRAEAMDIMLQTVSGDNNDVSPVFFRGLIKDMAERYRPLEPEFDAQLTEIIEKRGKKKSEMSPQELTDEVFGAFLGSIDLDEERWCREYRDDAAAAAKCDVVLDAVAEREGLSVSHQELHDALERIAEQCGAELDDVLEQIDQSSVRWQLLRDKARALIVNSAVSKD